jgi:cytochrome P450
MSDVIAPAPFFLTTDPEERHRQYARLRQSGPVRRVIQPHGEPAWLVTGYAQARTALTDPRLAKTPAAFAHTLDPALRSAVSSHMLNVDPPEHTRLRRLVTAAFTRRRVEQLAPRIRQLTDELLDPIAGGTGFDLIAQFAYPLPIGVICELLGVPPEGREDFHHWSLAMVNSQVLGADAFAEASSALTEYLRKLIAAKRRHPGDDLTSSLVAARDDGDRLSEDELTSLLNLLLVAGHETTVNLIGNGVCGLLTQPGAWAWLAEGPGRVPAAIEELLRFDGPLQTTTRRVARETFEFGGATIDAGDIVLVALLAANRDATVLPDAELLDLARAPSQHLAFGHGLHFCLGAPLARLEGQIALTGLLARFPGLRLAVPREEILATRGVLMHGLQALPVSF